MKNVRNAVYTFKTLKLTVLPLRSDNYSYLIEDSGSGLTLVVDPSETKPIVAFCEKNNIRIDWILNTHHHDDHIEGNEGLQKRFGAKIAAPRYDIEKKRIRGEDLRVLQEESRFNFGNYSFQIFETPGHTLGHISLFLIDANWLFSGDTLFSLGCGRLFEGNGPMLWHSFLKLRDLPDNTLVFCGHEYTLSNAKFVESLGLQLKGFEAFKIGLETRLREEGKTIPSRLSDEKAFNPYFLADDDRLKKFGPKAEDVFTRVREMKDNF